MYLGSRVNYLFLGLSNRVLRLGVPARSPVRYYPDTIVTHPESTLAKVTITILFKGGDFSDSTFLNWP
jgi:hypothetical protein